MVSVTVSLGSEPSVLGRTRGTVEGPCGPWVRSPRLLAVLLEAASPGMVAELTSSGGGDVSGGEFHRETGIPPIRICLSTSSSLPGPRSLTVSGPLLIRTGCENTGVWSG